ncbi:aldo/keto reductase [Sphingobium lactosutens]|uniref:aldo/keto reductase n=1 Tax=Sphingobium lactosutens TaxID=522773 RepID=UPI0015BCC4A4|nr:aldo/keto reductase [Sphingobium lactosutens]NWK94340.1 aldo/keto reductase [Sphingobium lactosutens]
MTGINPLPQIALGNGGPTIGSQGLGCMGMSEFYGDTDEIESRATLELALQLGVTMFDTADVYGMGENERFLAPFIQAHRDQTVIATKFGYARTPETPDDWSLDNRPGFIRRAAENSLQRLGIEAIDLYYMHRRSADVPLAESIGAMADLVAEGKVRALGLSAVSAEELREAHAVHPIAALQSEWSIFTRDIEAEIVPVAVDLGVTLVPYSPLGRGMLTGLAFAESLSAGDARSYFPRFSAENRAANLRLVAKIEEIAAGQGITSAQVAIAWLYAKARELSVAVSPIPGTRSRRRLQENVAAVSLTLDQAAMAELEPLAREVIGIAI